MTDENMTDAEKLRAIAESLDYTGALYAQVEAADVLRHIADLLDAIPPETLGALKAGAWKAVPVEPTKAMLKSADLEIIVDYVDGSETLYPAACYNAMLAAAPVKPEECET